LLTAVDVFFKGRSSGADFLGGRLTSDAGRLPLKSTNRCWLIFDGAKHAKAITKLLVDRLRQAWSDVKITIRSDGGFCRWKLSRWHEKTRRFVLHWSLPQQSY